MTFSHVDLDEALRGIGPNVRQAFELSHDALVALRIPHVLVGGLAVNAYGHHYATRDVDYLVDAADAFTGSLVLSHRTGVPFEVKGVAIDYVTLRPDFPAGVQEAMRANVEAARSRADYTVVVQDWLLVWMKLNAGRSKDYAAVEGLLQAGLDAESVREHLRAVGPAVIVEKFARCVANAEGEGGT